MSDNTKITKIQVSVSKLQSGFDLGFAKAKRIFDQLIDDKVITKESDDKYYYYLKSAEDK